MALIGHGAFAASGTSPNKGVQKLHLEVFINGATSQLIAAMERAADGAISMTRAELKAIGVAAPGSGNEKDLVKLDAIPGLGWRYEASEQRLYLTLSDSGRLAKEYSADPFTGAIAQRKTEISRDYGLVLNYNAYATAGRSLSGSNSTYKTGSVTLDGRIFSPIGVVQQSAIAGTTLGKEGILRLDSSIVYAHPESMITGTVGDAISGGVNWSRPIRFGGGQISRQFSLRPDLVTAPLPSVSGSAALPSSVDVFVDNVRVASQQVDAGPYKITQLPVPSESGMARVVVRDVTGKETVSVLPFFTSSRLLKSGMFEYAIDAGFARLNYATESFHYSKNFAGLGTLRYGLNDWLTVETHAEGMRGLGNAGAGIVAGIPRIGLFSFAGAGSFQPDQRGAMAYASWQHSMFGLFFGASTQRTFGKYEDVASITSREATQSVTQNLLNSGFYSLNRSARPAIAMDRFTIGVPLSDWRASLALSFVNIKRAEGDRAHLLNISYSQTFLEKYHFFLNAFGDLANKRDAGVVAGLSFTFGPDIMMTSSISSTRDGHSGSVEMHKPLGNREHDYGWRVYDKEGQTSQRGATGTYRNPWARIEAGIRQDSTTLGGHAEVEGAIVATPSGVFASNRINDAFAIVDTGAPGAEVLHENRPVGRTDFRGKLLIPNLRSFQKARIGINPESLPSDQTASITDAEVMPGYRGSSTVQVKSLQTRHSARVELRDKNGEPLAVGTRVEHAEAKRVYTIGYGSVIYIPEVDEINSLSVQQGTSQCQYSFAKADRSGPKGKVGPLTCKLN